jgi:hypothetical protein
LLATPEQTSDTLLHSYQGWLDTSLNNELLLTKIVGLLSSITSGKSHENLQHGTIDEESRDSRFPAVDHHNAPSSPSDASQSSDHHSPGTGNSDPVVRPSSDELIAADLGIGYPSRKRTPVYSEFNSSFDNAVSATPAAEAVSLALPTVDEITVSGRDILYHPRQKRSRLYSFLLWLIPVVLVVIVVTYLQERQSPQSIPEKISDGKPGEPTKSTLKPLSSVKAAYRQLSSANSAQMAARLPVRSSSRTIAAPAQQVIPPTPSQSANQKIPSPPTPDANADRLTKLPDFIPQAMVDKSYGATHTNWERFVSSDVEYRVYREKNFIKAIQIIARGGINLSRDFVEGVSRQIAANPVFTSDSSLREKGFKVERGHLTGNINMVNYRDETSGGLKALVITWR